MFTLNKLLIALEDAAKITFEGEHFETGESVFTGDLWRIWPSPDGLESVKQERLRAALTKETEHENRLHYPGQS